MAAQMAGSKADLSVAQLLGLAPACNTTQALESKQEQSESPSFFFSLMLLICCNESKVLFTPLVYY